mmetsp:Transcript_22595/g.67295  ORF Transcript_22595/g.67295 Transcript_22595/m.67295 type:complete len:153 (-) Transcript_22595:3327-3785(-)
MAAPPGEDTAATAGGASAASASEVVSVKGIQDIQTIEEKVIGCIDIAAEVAEQLSKIGDADKDKVLKLCREFMANIQTAQVHVKEGIKKSVNNRAFEASSYHARTRAQIAIEKVAMVYGQIEAMEQVLQLHANQATEHGANAMDTSLADEPA